MKRNPSESLCKRTINAAQLISNAVHTVVNHSNIYEFMAFPVYLRKLNHEQTDRESEFINNFLECWKVLKSQLMGILFF